MDQPSSLNPYDDTASDPTRVGRRRFLAGIGAAAGAGAAGALLPATSVQAALPAGASNFHSLPAAVRLADTRTPSKYPQLVLSNRKIRVKIGGAAGVPSTATAAVCTLTAVNLGHGNHVTAWPTGVALPTASNLNLDPHAVAANLVTVKLGTNGQVDVQALRECSLILDVIGYYSPVSGAVREGRFVALDTPRRAYDSRLNPGRKAADRSYTVIDITPYVPAHAGAASLNLTVDQATKQGHFTVLPGDAPNVEPTTSSLNVTGAGDIRAGAVVVPVKTVNNRRLVKVYTRSSAHLILDVMGYYTSAVASLSQVGLFVSLVPTRILDSRLPGQVGRMWPGWTVEAKLPSSVASIASAAVVNVTGTDTRAGGYFTVAAARVPRPATSNVNWTRPWATVPNHAMTRVTATHGMQIYSSHGAACVVDLNGYFTGTPEIPQLAAPNNPPPPAAAPPWVLRVPRLGLTSSVLAGDPIGVTDSGHSWHWTGTGYMGQASHVAVFAHRTDAGGPYRYVHLLQVGDTITITTQDGREFTYRMVGRLLTNSNTTNILNATRAHPGTTFSMIACTRTDWLPTSLSYRIVVNFELVSWREI